MAHGNLKKLEISQGRVAWKVCDHRVLSTEIRSPQSPRLSCSRALAIEEQFLSAQRTTLPQTKVNRANRLQTETFTN